VGFPDAVTPELMEDEQFLKQFHHALLEVRSPRLAKAGRGPSADTETAERTSTGPAYRRPQAHTALFLVSSVPRGMATKQLSSRRGVHGRDAHLTPSVVWMQLHVEEGQLICPESGRRFPIQKGIPNMLLNEDEC